MFTKLQLDLLLAYIDTSVIAAIQHETNDVNFVLSYERKEQLKAKLIETLQELH